MDGYVRRRGQGHRAGQSLNSGTSDSQPRALGQSPRGPEMFFVIWESDSRFR